MLTFALYLAEIQQRAYCVSTMLFVLPEFKNDEKADEAKSGAKALEAVEDSHRRRRA